MNKNTNFQLIFAERRNSFKVLHTLIDDFFCFIVGARFTDVPINISFVEVSNIILDA